jgi:hypothetical protein
MAIRKIVTKTKPVKPITKAKPIARSVSPIRKPPVYTTPGFKPGANIKRTKR